MIYGRFAHRFNGFSVDSNSNPFALVGLGTIDVGEGGSITGSQHSSVTQLLGLGLGFPLHAKYVLTGQFRIDASGTGTAEITFTSPQQTMIGTFDVQVVDQDRIWLISSGGRVTLPSPAIFNEVVSGELVRLS